MNESENTGSVWPPPPRSPRTSPSRYRLQTPAGVWIVAGFDLLVGACLLLGTVSARPVAADDGLGAFDWLIFLLDLMNAGLLLAVPVYIARRHEKALRLAGEFQRWAAWAFLLHGAADIGLSMVVVNESMTGTFAFLGGLILLIPAGLCFWGSRYLAGAVPQKEQG